MTEQLGPLERVEGPHAGRAPWFRLALLKTIVGCALGLFSSAAVIWFSHKAFPQVGEFSVDAGLKLRVSLDRLTHLPTGLAKDDGASFVFLDVDPQYEGDAVCKAIAENFPRPLDCHSARPVNRYVLAKLIDDLQSRKPRLIVLDVVLASDHPVVPREESDELAAAMGRSIVPIVYAAPAELNWREGDVDSAPEVRVDVGDEFPGALITSKPKDNTAANVHAAIAFPEADQPIRRYRKCYALAGADEAAYTLPWLAAKLLSMKPGDAKLGACSDGDNPAPRIFYTIPPIDGHQDMQLTSERARWAFYRNIYTRCLVSKFWEKNRSRCGGVDDVTSLYDGKVVVIGASNPARRDWHYTPLGNMAGPEVVINAIRSFQRSSKEPEPTASSTLWHEAQIVMTCSLIWLLFHSLRYGTAGAVGKRFAPLQQIRRSLFVAVTFVATLLLVLGVTLHMSFTPNKPEPSLSILVGVLAITLEQYVDAMEWVLHRVSAVAARLLGISKEAGH